MMRRDLFDRVLALRGRQFSRRVVAVMVGVPLRVVIWIEASALWAERDGSDPWSVFVTFRERGLFPFDADGELL